MRRTSSSRVVWLAAWLLAAASWAGGSAAQGAGPAWSSLSRPQQEALAPLQREWPQIDADRKKKWLEVASRFPSMPTQERDRIQQRMAEWARLTPAERGQARLQFQQTRQFTAEDRQARWEAYRALPEEQRVELAKRNRPAGNGTGTTSKPAPGAEQTLAKRNLVTPPASPTTKAVTPTVVQIKPGATTTLMSAPPKPPVHQQSGLPKIAATEGFVDKQTLLPKRGPQGAAVRSAAAASAPIELAP